MSYDEQPDAPLHGECAEEISRLERELAAAIKRADAAGAGAKHSLPYIVQYMRQDDSDIWHDMAAFDYQSAALKYAESCANETWKCRVIDAKTEREILRNG
jgi:hypothetical protein